MARKTFFLNGAEKHGAQIPEARWIYRLARLHSVRVLDQSFLHRPDFDLPAYWPEHLEHFEDTFGRYRCTLRIHPRRETFVKWLMPGRWQPVNDIDERGWIRLSLVMDTDLLAEILIFGRAGFVEVSHPPALKDAVLPQARAVIQDLEG